MTLGGALDSAITGLQANQRALGVVANNIANANTEGYTRRSASTSPQILNGETVGVTIEEVRRVVDQSIIASKREQLSDVGYTDIVSQFYSDVSLFLGAPGQENSLSFFLDDAFSALSDLSNSPESPAVRNTAVNALENVVDNVSALAGSLEGVRYDIDQEIGGVVTDINRIVDEIFNLNESIRQAAFSEIQPNALLDRRDELVEEISSLIDVSVSISGVNEVSLTLPTGTLLAPGQASHLFYTPVGTEAAFVAGATIGDITFQQVDSNGNLVGNQSSTLVTSSLDEPALEPNFASGSLRGLLDLRDRIFPDVLSQLDGLAANLTESFNAIHNQGSGFPPPTQLTGTTAVTNGQDFLFSGSVRVGVVGSDGQPIPAGFGNGDLSPFELNFDEYTGVNGSGRITIEEFIDEFNNYYGAPPTQIVNQGPLQDIDIAAVSTTISSTKATGSITFDGNVGVGDTLEINGVLFNFVASGTASSSTDIEIGGAISNTVSEIVNVLNNSTNPNVAEATYGFNATGDTLIVTHDTAGTAPNGVFGLNADVSNGGGTANINGVGASANPAVSFLGVGNATAGVDANGTFTFDLEAFNVTGGDATIEVLDVAVDGVLSGASFGPQIIEPGERGRTEASGGTLTVPLPSTAGEGGTHTLAVQIRTTAPDGAVVESVVEYEIDIPDPETNIRNTRYGFTAVASGGAEAVTQIDNNAFAFAQLVDADGRAIADDDTTTPGFLQITTDGERYGIVFDELTSQEGGESGVTSQATNRGFSHFFGLNNYFELSDPNNAALGFSIREEFRGDPSRLATGALSLSSQPADPDANPIYTYEIGQGSNQIANALAALGDADVNFDSAGNIPAVSATFTQYSGEIISFFVTDANIAQSDAEQAQLIFDTFQQRFETVSGVNVDEELANTVIFQNNYTATARLITVISDLFEQLVSSLQ